MRSPAFWRKCSTVASPGDRHDDEHREGRDQEEEDLEGYLNLFGAVSTLA